MKICSVWFISLSFAPVSCHSATLICPPAHCYYYYQSPPRPCPHSAEHGTCCVGPFLCCSLYTRMGVEFLPSSLTVSLSPSLSVFVVAFPCFAFCRWKFFGHWGNSLPSRSFSFSPFLSLFGRVALLIMHIVLCCSLNAFRDRYLAIYMLYMYTISG